MSNEATIITGGGRGIGRAISLRMSKEGPVLLVGRTEADLASACGEISGSGGDAAFVVGDVTDPMTAQQAVLLTKEKGWELRNLVCNAGIGKSGSLETFDPALWKNIFDVNVNGTFHFIQACVPQMLERKEGSVVLVSSVAGSKGYGYNSAYVATKHALVGLARSMAEEYGKRGILTVAICPDLVEGEMTDRVIRGVMQRHGLDETAARERIVKKLEHGRILLPEEVAEAVAQALKGE